MKIDKGSFPSLQIDGWKMNFPFRMAYFQGWTVSFGEGNQEEHDIITWLLVEFDAFIGGIQSTPM